MKNKFEDPAEQLSVANESDKQKIALSMFKDPDLSKNNPFENAVRIINRHAPSYLEKTIEIALADETITQENFEHLASAIASHAPSQLFKKMIDVAFGMELTGMRPVITSKNIDKILNSALLSSEENLQHVVTTASDVGLTLPKLTNKGILEAVENVRRDIVKLHEDLSWGRLKKQASSKDSSSR